VFIVLYEARFASNKSYPNSSILLLKYITVLTSRLLLSPSVDNSATCFLTEALHSFSIICKPDKFSTILLFLTSSPQYYIQSSSTARSNVSLTRYWLGFCRDILWSLNVTVFRHFLKASRLANYYSGCAANGIGCGLKIPLIVK